MRVYLECWWKSGYGVTFALLARFKSPWGMIKSVWAKNANCGKSNTLLPANLIENFSVFCVDRSHFTPGFWLYDRGVISALITNHLCASSRCSPANISGASQIVLYSTHKQPKIFTRYSAAQVWNLLKSCGNFGHFWLTFCFHTPFSLFTLSHVLICVDHDELKSAWTGGEEAALMRLSLIMNDVRGLRDC